jgi:hypothetical protein
MINQKTARTAAGAVAVTTLTLTAGLFGKAYWGASKDKQVVHRIHLSRENVGYRYFDGQFHVTSNVRGSGRSEIPQGSIFRRIEVLDLSSKMSMDDYLMLLSELRQLKALQLGNSSITDDELIYVSRCTQLECLGLVNLLKQVRIQETKITQEGARRLQEMLPNTRVIYFSTEKSQ